MYPQGRGMKKAGKRGTNKKGSKKAGGTRSKSGKASGMMIRGDDLSQKIYATMDKHKEVGVLVARFECSLGFKSFPLSPPLLSSRSSLWFSCSLPLSATHPSGARETPTSSFPVT